MTLAPEFRHQAIVRAARASAILKAAQPKDGDGDGFVYDATPRQRAAPRLPSKKVVTSDAAASLGGKSPNNQPDYSHITHSTKQVPSAYEKFKAVIMQLDENTPHEYIEALTKRILGNYALKGSHAHRLTKGMGDMTSKHGPRSRGEKPHFG